MITVETVIAATPIFVRDIFVDFSKLHAWHTSGWIKSIRSLTPGKTSGGELVVGDKMRSEIAGMSFNQTVLENTPTTFRWVGPWYGVLTGTHIFTFLPHPTLADHTILTQSEAFTGLLSYWMESPDSMGGKKTLIAFEGVNGDLKRYAEKEWTGISEQR
ncbi:uncharacterized protein MKK02DRAFT_45523 [Dioszegia hungarica]|uniref:SRPBCC domain-containing protein n=1 Tax=Dioszegia hungarica TaxID=4972 RepID=A0AA38HAR0_9TREE|nr:uncharacterized protein MKK02DRAFT_45523 [Dioszegia hungarica]KAI9636816.1 hypothetical protein MKK02DRAFT_45523 [Dioszegia hungarica]